jgi:hypothetical protein
MLDRNLIKVYYDEALQEAASEREYRKNLTGRSQNKIIGILILFALVSVAVVWSAQILFAG